MIYYKYIILGAGPAGLSFANRLLENGETSFILLEKDSTAGGLCKSEMVDGSPLDTGGGHFLDAKNITALKFIFQFLPEEDWNIFDRISTIKLKHIEIDYPFESNIWQFPIKDQMEYLMDIISSGSVSGKKMPKLFIDWISWKLGTKIANDYMIPYNEKIWSIDLNRLGTYWLYKLPDVSVKQTLLSCLEKSPSGQLPAHEKFYYPKKYGYGEVWKRMANTLGDRIIYNTPVVSIQSEKRIVNDSYYGDTIISTIPWPVIKFSDKIPQRVRNCIKSLEHTSIRVSYIPKRTSVKAHWTYIPDKNISEHRHLYRFNFIKDAIGYWTETNEKRAGKSNNKSWLNEFAYPLNLLSKPQSIKEINVHFTNKSIIGLGRWGEWEHMNSDIAVVKGIKLADKMSNL